MDATRTYNRAPKGGILFNGKSYRGGQFVPAAAVAPAAPSLADILKEFGATMNPWNDRVYVNFAAARRDHRGDASKKLWFRAGDPTNFVAERGKGTESAEFFYAYRGALEALQSAGFAVQVR